MTTYTTEDFENARFATRPDGWIAARTCIGPSAHLYPWRCSDIPGRSDRAMAEDGWVPVQECPDPEQHGPVDYKVLFEREEARAEKAEEAEGEAEARSKAWEHLHNNLAARYHQMTAREHMEAAWDAAHVPEDGTIPAGAEYVERYGDGSFYGPLTSGGGLRAGRGVLERRLLDPPAPARPEGAEEIEASLLAVQTLTGVEAKQRVIADLADALAERGVRVTGAES